MVGSSPSTWGFANAAVEMLFECSTTIDGIIEKVHEELEEVLTAEGPDHLREELGDLMMVVVNLARRHGIVEQVADIASFFDTVSTIAVVVLFVGLSALVTPESLMPLLVPALITALRDESELVRAGAARALAAQGHSAGEAMSRVSHCHWSRSASDWAIRSGTVCAATGVVVSNRARVNSLFNAPLRW